MNTYHEISLGFCNKFTLEKRKKRDLQESGFYINNRLKRDDILTEEEILKRSYKARLG